VRSHPLFFGERMASTRTPPASPKSDRKRKLVNRNLHLVVGAGAEGGGGNSRSALTFALMSHLHSLALATRASVRQMQVLRVAAKHQLHCASLGFARTSVIPGALQYFVIRAFFDAIG
jgi:hypothetical protein